MIDFVLEFQIAQYNRALAILHYAGQRVGKVVALLRYGGKLVFCSVYFTRLPNLLWINGLRVKYPIPIGQCDWSIQTITS